LQRLFFFAFLTDIVSITLGVSQGRDDAVVHSLTDEITDLAIS